MTRLCCFLRKCVKHLATDATARSIAVFAGTLQMNRLNTTEMLILLVLSALLFMMMMMLVLAIMVIVQPIKHNGYWTGIGHFSEMFFQCLTRHLGLEENYQMIISKRKCKEKPCNSTGCRQRQHRPQPLQFSW